MSRFTPKSPLGYFCKILIFSFLPLGVGEKKAENRNFSLFGTDSTIAYFKPFFKISINNKLYI